jgi:putative membrane protein
MQPQVLDVPLVAPLAWPALVYLADRGALLVLPAGVEAAAGAAVLATLPDVATGVDALAEGVWEVPEHPVSGLQWRGVPLWNFAAWLGVVFLTAMLPTWL